MLSASVEKIDRVEKKRPIESPICFVEYELISSKKGEIKFRSWHKHFLIEYFTSFHFHPFFSLFSFTVVTHKRRYCIKGMAKFVGEKCNSSLTGYVNFSIASSFFDASFCFLPILFLFEIPFFIVSYR